MAYLNLTDTAVGDPVRVITSLDDNWDQIDAKFSVIDSKAASPGTGVTNPETGMEFVRSQGTPPTITVWTGSSYKIVSTSETWGAWTNITLQTNYNAVAGRTPQLRLSNFGHIQCRGAIQYLTGTTAWPGGYVLVNAGQFAAASYSPSQISVQNLAATPTLTTTWAYGQSYVTTASGFVNLYLMYTGAALASGNLISLDKLSWYAG